MIFSTNLNFKQCNNTPAHGANCVHFTAIPKKQMCDTYLSKSNIDKSMKSTVTQFFNRLIKPFKPKNIFKSHNVEINNDGTKNITLVSKNFDTNGLSAKYKNYDGNNICPMEIRYKDKDGEQKCINVGSFDIGYLKEQLQNSKESSGVKDNITDTAIALLTSPKQIEKNVKSDNDLLLSIKKIESLLINEVIP